MRLYIDVLGRQLSIQRELLASKDISVQKENKGMNVQEKFQQEMIKNLIRQTIQNNNCMAAWEKKAALERFEEAVRKTDWLINMLKVCGYIQ